MVSVRVYVAGSSTSSRGCCGARIGTKKAGKVGLTSWKLGKGLAINLVVRGDEYDGAEVAMLVGDGGKVMQGGPGSIHHAGGGARWAMGNCWAMR